MFIPEDLAPQCVLERGVNQKAPGNEPGAIRDSY